MTRFQWVRWLIGGTWVKWHGRWVAVDRSGAMSYVDKSGVRHTGSVRSAGVTAREVYKRLSRG